MPFKKIQLVAVVLAIYGAYNVWMVVKYGQPLFLLWSVSCFVASVGLWLRKPWSRFVVYAVCSFTIFGLLLYVAAMGFNGWPYPGPAKAVVALAPGAYLAALCIWLMVVVFRFFRAAKKQT